MVKIAFLFLIISDVYHEAYWKEFFTGNEDRSSIYVHAKQTVPNKSFFKQYEMNYKIPTTWAHTIRAQIALLKEALKDPENQKFIFISESTIPLQNFAQVYQEVMATEKSIISFKKNPHRDPANQLYTTRNLRTVSRKYQKKNPQWVILNRKHAELMAQDTQYINIISRYPCDNEHYPSTFLAIHGLLDEVINKPTTFVHWKQIKPGRLPTTFENLRNKKEKKVVVHAIKDGYLFARKFYKKCKLAPLNKYLSYKNQLENRLNR